MKKFLLVCALSSFAALPASAALFIVGQVGTNQAGTALEKNNWPGAEHPALAMDGNTGTKYLNFAKLDTGILYTAPVGTPAITLTGLGFSTANDQPPRDPASYTLYGSNSVIATTNPGDSFDLSNFTEISAGVLSLPTDRNVDGDDVAIAGADAYTSFLLIFPTVRDEGAANSMQISEIRFLTAAGTAPAGTVAGGVLDPVPEPGTFALSGLVGLALAARRRR